MNDIEQIVKKFFNNPLNCVVMARLAQIDGDKRSLREIVNIIGNSDKGEKE